LPLGLPPASLARARTLLIDLNLDCPEVAPLLDTGCSKTIYHLAYNAQLAPVSPDELEDHLGWRDGLAVLAGITHPEHAERITDHFLSGLLEAASGRFEHVVMDLGRLRVSLANPLTSTTLLWVVQPSPLGMEGNGANFPAHRRPERELAPGHSAGAEPSVRALACRRREIPGRGVRTRSGCEPA